MSLQNFVRRTRLLIQQALYETRKLTQSGYERQLQLTRLEERMLFSASAIAPVVAQIAEVGGSLMDSAAPAGDSTLFQVPDQQLLDLVADSVLPSTTESDSRATSEEHTLELVFLDSSISNLDQMMSDLRAAGATDGSRTLEFVVLDSQRDGIAQITSALLRSNGVDGLHIVSHGGTGQVQLGSTWLSMNNLDTYRTAISAWQYSMSDKADILFYGCNLAASVEGQQLLREISALTDSDTAASEDLTGSATKGGDWDLEYQNGDVETHVAFSDEFQSTWDQILATYTVTTTDDSGAGSLRQAILDANANAGTDTITFNIGSGVQTINLLSNLPQITGTVILDATTQSGYSNAPLIEINGASYAAASEYGFDLGENADNSFIKGFVINRFSTYGIYLNGADNVTIAGNYIGTNAAGTASQANGTGIYILAASSGNVIGGSTSTERNVISGNTTNNITILGDTNVIKGNYVGTSASGLSGLTSPTGSSIRVTSGINNTIGGLNAGEGNVVTNGGTSGVNIAGGSNTSVLGNIIGMSADKSSFLGSTNDGISVSSVTSTGNVFLQNSIAGNGGLAIDLTDDGVTANDSNDGDSGANNLQNYATLTSAVVLDPSTMQVGGTLNSAASTNYRIEFFSNTTGDVSGYGEGQTYVGFVNVVTNASNNATFSTLLSGNFTPGLVISSTTTRLTSGLVAVETSEFSQNITSVSEKGLWLSTAAGATTSAGTGTLSMTDGLIGRLSDPNLMLGSGTSNGLFTKAFDIDNFTADGNADVNGMHWVSSTVTVGTTNAIILQRGDILLTTGGSETLGGVAVTTTNIVAFRPTTAGNYSSGTFFVVLKNPGGTGNNLREFALVETAMTVGGTTLQAGDFLLVLGSATYDKDVSQFQGTTMATANTGGNLSNFVDGSAAGVGFAQKIYSLDLVQQNTTVGGVSLTQGQLLVGLNGSDLVGTNNLSVTAYDLFSLSLTATGASSSGSTTMFLRGSDVGMSAAGEEYDAFALVDAYNDAPVLADTALSITVAEDAGVPSGVVGSLLSNFTGGISDVDSGAVKGIAITASNETNGVWYYTTNGGTNWTAIGSVNSGSSLLLADNANTRLYFAPGLNYNGTSTAALTIRAWDQSNGTAGTKVSTSTTGNLTAFSTATDVIDVTVTAVNDAPTASNLNSAETYTEDTALNLTDIVVGDVDNASVTATLTLSNTAAGSLNTGTSGAVTSTYNAGTGVWSASGAIADVNTLLAALTFTPAANFNSNFTIATSVSDGSLSVTGSKAMSGTAINDAPTLSAGTGFSGINEDDVTNTGMLVSAFASLSGDVDAGALQGIAVYSVDNTNGTWQYTLDGTNWIAIGNVSTSSARLLPSDAVSRIRFVPNADWNGATGVTSMKAWDQTSGTAGSLADVTVTGGSTAFSVGNAGGNIVAFDPANGKILW
ncbi:MAG: DUF4347 domain-containing protein, partial [Planctomycetaceae bacterium]